MTNDPNPPQQMSEVLLDVAGQLLESIHLVKETCPAEAVAYTRAARHILCQLFAKVVCIVSSADPIPVPDPAKPMRRHPMLANAVTAERVSTMMREASERLAECPELGRGAMSEETFKAFALGVGGVLADIMYEVLHPIFELHPSLEPEGWK